MGRSNGGILKAASIVSYKLVALPETLQIVLKFHSCYLLLAAAAVYISLSEFCTP